jgi:hypothetical protein
LIIQPNTSQNCATIKKITILLLNTFETEMKYLKNILGSYLFFIGMLGLLWPGCVADKNGQSELKAKAVKAEL